MHGQQAAYRRAAAADFFVEEAKGNHIHARASVLPCYKSAQIPLLGYSCNEVGRSIFLLIVAIGFRNNLLLNEGAKRSPVVFLLRGQFDFHTFLSARRKRLRSDVDARGHLPLDQTRNRVNRSEIIYIEVGVFDRGSELLLYKKHQL